MILDMLLIQVKLQALGLEGIEKFQANIEKAILSYIVSLVKESY